MKFIITRTSLWDKKPCREAIKEMVPYWHERSCTEEYFNKMFSINEGLWRSKGKNHKTTEGGKNIARQEDDVPVWVININSLEELIKFNNKYGQLILGSGDGYNSLEIYDGYRE